MQSLGPFPYPTETEEQIVDATVFGLVGTAKTSLTTGTGPLTLAQVEAVQSTTPALAQSFWLSQPKILEKNFQPPGGPATGFKTRKVKGRSVLDDHIGRPVAHRSISYTGTRLGAR